MGGNLPYGVALAVGLADPLDGRGWEERGQLATEGPRSALHQPSGDVGHDERLARRRTGERGKARPFVQLRRGGELGLHRVHREVPEQTAEIVVRLDGLGAEPTLKRMADGVMRHVE